MTLKVQRRKLKDNPNIEKRITIHQVTYDEKKAITDP